MIEFRDIIDLNSKDPREALILSLKREVTVLQSENEHLRAALNHYSESGSPSGKLNLF